MKVHGFLPKFALETKAPLLIWIKSAFVAERRWPGASGSSAPGVDMGLDFTLLWRGRFSSLAWTFLFSGVDVSLLWRGRFSSLAWTLPGARWGLTRPDRYPAR
ncbi:hypothetical protein [Halomonas sp. DN3]|uniref:hypothetical protein n=1 Tax=Halomonas sp. DN3 TaxID=2953657 RepID=UPI00209D37E5|nr:hypothetical protein [Halomonas sp. DN3]USZ49799.1 hypothetical protein NKF27_20365 [Halomonas sp. DN3]